MSNLCLRMHLSTLRRLFFNVSVYSVCTTLLIKMGSQGSGTSVCCTSDTHRKTMACYYQSLFVGLVNHLKTSLARKDFSGSVQVLLHYAHSALSLPLFYHCPWYIYIGTGRRISCTECVCKIAANPCYSCQGTYVL